MLGLSLRAGTRLLPFGVCAIMATVVFQGLALGAALPNDRAYELVSPPTKFGGDVLAESTRTHASAGESPALPAAVSFASLGGFGDVRGTGVGTEYLAQRTGLAGTSGWSTHAITPRQEPLPYFALTRSLEPVYTQVAPDLSQAIFQSWSPVTDAPNVEGVSNLYARSDLRKAGSGAYRLLSDAPAPVPPFDLFAGVLRNPITAGFTEDLEHVVFESTLNLTSDARGRYVKVYKKDGATTRLITNGSGCPGGHPSLGPGQCSLAGIGAQAVNRRYTPRVLSADGTRTVFTAPVMLNNSGGTILGVSTRAGTVSKVLQLDDRGTASLGDDVMIHVNASEIPNPSPDQARAARYQTASADGSRIFFVSAEQLTDRAGGGLYLWERQGTDETQAVTVDATGGSFTLTTHAQVSSGSGTLTRDTNVVRSVSAGSFAVGQTVTGNGVPAGTTITGMGTFQNATNSTLTLSNRVSVDGVEQLVSSVDATTGPLPHDATAAQVAAALEGSPAIGSGNVTVTGGPGGAGGGSAYVVTFTGALSGVNVAELTADGGLLTGGAATATVLTTRPLRNLTLLASVDEGPQTTGVIGASDDGRRVYFATGGSQLVSGAPPVVLGAGIYFWQDADGTPGGTLYSVGGVDPGDMQAIINSLNPLQGPRVARVTPDGRYLAVTIGDGSAFEPRFDHTSACLELSNPTQNTATGCGEVYVYRADTSSPTDPDVVCASCAPSSAPATRNASLDIRMGASLSVGTTYLNRALSVDGRRVFFTSGDALVADDRNGRFDAYQYDVPTGVVHLISSGRDANDSYFLDASATGDDVYFVTREQLVGWDRDAAYDLYDARVGGGFPEPVPVPECVGDACQGAAPGAPGAAALGSAIFRGSGNARPPARTRPAKRCRRGQIKRRVRGRARCVRRGRRARQHTRRGAATRRTK